MPTSPPCALTSDQKEIHRLLAEGNGNEYLDQGMQTCIDACGNCHQTCRRTLATINWSSGGSKAHPAFQVLLECSDLCELSVKLQLAQSPYSERLCILCAEACRECERQCNESGVADECAEACRLCAESCEAMAS